MTTFSMLGSSNEEEAALLLHEHQMWAVALSWLGSPWSEVGYALGPRELLEDFAWQQLAKPGQT